MAFLRLSLLILPALGIAALTFHLWHKNNPESKRGILKFAGAVAALSIVGAALGAALGVELYCRISTSNLCGIGGLLVGGLSGLYLGCVGTCIWWYRKGGAS